MRRLIILCIVSIFFFFSINLIFANPPHRPTWTADINKLVNCSSCHVAHGAVGASLTKDVNAALCMSCHTTTSSSASEKSFADSDQADLQTTPTSGTSHRWDQYLPTGACDNSNNDYGLRPVDCLSNTSLRNAALKFKHADGRGGVTCSTCHRQHSQTFLPWDPYYGPASNDPTSSNGYRGIATATAGNNVTIIDSSKTWTTNWANSVVVISGPDTSLNYNKERRVVSNTTNTLTVSPAFPAAVALGETYSITSGRHYQRMNNTEDIAANDMCVDCHYHRATTTAIAVRTYDGNKKSHPIGKNLTTDVTDASQFVGAAPFEPQSASWSAQTGPNRYAGNGGADNNSTNNIVLDSNSKVRCMSCHGVHYTDSDSSTEDRSHDDRVP